MSLENFLKGKKQYTARQGNGVDSRMESQLNGKWTIIILNLLWIGSLPLWVMYLYGLAFVIDGRWITWLVALVYVTFPVSVYDTLRTSFRLFRLKEYSRGVRVSIRPFAWLLSLYLLGLLMSF